MVFRRPVALMYFMVTGLSGVTLHVGAPPHRQRAPPPPHLKSKAKLDNLSYFRKYTTKIYKNVCF